MSKGHAKKLHLSPAEQKARAQIRAANKAARETEAAGRKLFAIAGAAEREQARWKGAITVAELREILLHLDPSLPVIIQSLDCGGERLEPLGSVTDDDSKVVLGD